MNIYFSGIGGVGIGSLAEIAQSAGHKIFGSDTNSSPFTENLKKSGAKIKIGQQDGKFLKQVFIENEIDWFVYTAALPKNHPELLMAQELGLNKITKRDELLNHIITEKNLKLIAVSGTHGKTTTTGMAIWTFKQLNIPISWSIGTTLSFGKSGFFDPESIFFIYETDEFDRNFLNFSPVISLITSIDYDHADVYKNEAEYLQAFTDFARQSDFTFSWRDQHPEVYNDISNKILLKNPSSKITLAGKHNRKNATLVLEAIDFLAENGFDFKEDYYEKTIKALNSFTGTDRRFEKISNGVFSDYAHHPVEIQATLEMANEISNKLGFSGVSLIYQPHQNTRQIEVQNNYTSEVFQYAHEVLWLPTFLTRENTKAKILSPEFLARKIISKTEFFEIFSENDTQLLSRISELRKQNRLILAMSAGSLDKWIRQNIK